MAKFPNKTHYSMHFSRKELDCKCGCRTPRRIQRRLRITALGLEKMSRELGKIRGSKKRAAIGVNSGYRCKAHNKAVGGAVRSQHLTGKAADVVVPAGKQAQYLRAALKVRSFKRGGIGVYPNGGLHVDWRGVRARWNSFIGQ